MGFARTCSVALVGVEGVVVEVQADLEPGVAAFTLVGLPDKSLTESRDRVRAAGTARRSRMAAARARCVGCPTSGVGAQIGGRGRRPRLHRYGAHMAATLAAGLAERGWVVVSGGAYGVDGAAHRGALGAGGATVAVLACGVDRPYPRGHAQLITRIAEQGLVVGELPPGEHPTPSRFVLRNRVIAALTRGTVVVEAAYRSGSLVTARAAQRLGRHTMGVPGPATSGLSAGVHELLRQDAVLVTDAAEVVELVGDMGELAPDRRGPVVPRDLLDAAARRVLAALPGRGVAKTDEIARGAQTTPDDAIARLYELRALGYVERHGDGWKLTRQSMISVRGGRHGC
ncbi:hypothetical protein SALBM311S_05367 [Streptomyces alboniger]